MRDWTFWTNSYTKTGHVEVITQPWWLAFIESFAHWIDWDWLYKIPLPNWPKIKWMDDVEEFGMSPKEWLGDVGGLVFYFVTNPLLMWAFNNPRRESVHINLGYDKIKELFYETDKEYFDEAELRLAEIKISEAWGNRASTEIENG